MSAMDRYDGPAYKFMRKYLRAVFVCMGKTYRRAIESVDAFFLIYNTLTVGSVCKSLNSVNSCIMRDNTG